MNKIRHAFEESNTLHSNTWVDFNEFDKLLNLAASEPDPAQQISLLQQAVSLYRGDFWGDLPFNQTWITSWCNHFQQRYLAALQMLSILYEQAGDVETAQQVYLSTFRAKQMSAEYGRSLIDIELTETNNGTSQTLRQCKRLISLLQSELEILLEEYGHPLAESASLSEQAQEGWRG